MLEEGTFHQLSRHKRSKLLQKLRERLKAINSLLPRPRMREALAGIALLLGTTASHSLEAQSFAPPVASPFGLVAGQTYNGFPAFADLDNDGDLDLFFMSYDYYTYVSTLTFYENTGTPESPSFNEELPVLNPFGIQDLNIPLASLLFADLDGDGDLDLLMSGYGYGYNYTGENIYYMENIGTPEAPAFGPLQTNPFGLSSSGFLNLPAAADLDGDGDLDLLVGGILGTLTYFENIGTPQAPAFAPPVTNPFGLFVDGYIAIPLFADLDQDGDLDFYCMSVATYYNFNMVYQPNNGTPQSPSFGPSQPAPFGIEITNTGFSVPTFADIDNDGDLDFFYNNLDYGTFYFQENTGTQTNLPPTSANTAVTGLQDQSYYFSASDFPYDDDDGDDFAGVQVTELPPLGKLQFNGVDVVAGQTIPADEIGQLAFLPNAGEFNTPYSLFKFRVWDGTLYSISEYTMVINIQQVSDVKERNLDIALSLSPNPAGEVLTLRAETAGVPAQARALLYDGQGQQVLAVVLSENTTTFTREIDISSLAPGLYFLKVQFGERWKATRFVKE